MVDTHGATRHRYRTVIYRLTEKWRVRDRDHELITTTTTQPERSISVHCKFKVYKNEAFEEKNSPHIQISQTAIVCIRPYTHLWHQIVWNFFVAIKHLFLIKELYFFLLKKKKNYSSSGAILVHVHMVSRGWPKHLLNLT